MLHFPYMKDKAACYLNYVQTNEKYALVSVCLNTTFVHQKYVCIYKKSSDFMQICWAFISNNKLSILGMQFESQSREDFLFILLSNNI